MRDHLSLFPEAECCVGEAASEACWEPCYCVLLQDEQTLTAYRSEDMAVSTFFSKSLSDSPGFIHPATVSLSPLSTRDTIIRHETDLHRCCYMFVFRNARFVGSPSDIVPVVLIERVAEFWIIYIYEKIIIQ